VEAKILDGSAVSKEIRGELAQRVEKLKREKGVTPRLSVILVGEDPASVTYTRMRSKASSPSSMQTPPCTELWCSILFLPTWTNSTYSQLWQ
jgi:methylenetetrahydrofolate dehydrogenase (NADP+)/methenyltetrahydrofolate cyclohydrolase